LKFEEFRTGIRQGPAKGLPTSLFRAPRNRLTPTLLRCRLELTAVSAICLLGLAIWFSKTEPLVALATVCYGVSRLLCCTPFYFGGRILYFEALLLSSGQCRFVFCASPRPSSVEGVRNLLRLRLPCQPTSLTPAFPPIPLRRRCDFAVSRGGASTTAASGVNSAR